MCILGRHSKEPRSATTRFLGHETKMHSLELSLPKRKQKHSKAIYRQEPLWKRGEEGAWKARGHTFSELFETGCLQSPPILCCQGLILSAKIGTHTHTPIAPPQPQPPPHSWIFLILNSQKFPDQPYLFGTAPPPGLDSHLIISESPESRA